LPGFGHGPFGHMAFGEWWWSRYVLYDLIPSLYKERDDSGFLEKFSESLRPSFDTLRRKMRDFGELRDPLLVRAAATETQNFRFGKQVVLRGTIEQSGVDGKVVIFGEFTAKTARFTEADKGKELTVTRSSKPENNKSVTIVAVVDAQTVAVSPRLSLDVGPVRWNVRQTYVDPPNQATVEIRSGGTELGKVAGGWLVNDGFASFEVRDRQMFIVPADERTLLTERDGDLNGTIDSSGRLSAPNYQFSLSDVGKLIFIAGSNYVTNNGRFEIYGVDKLSPTDYRAVFSRLDITGLVPLTGLHDSAGTVRYANKPGKAARVIHVRGGISTPFSISVLGSDITVNLATDSFGNVTTTANALVAAVSADPFAGALVTVVAPGAGTGIVAPTGFLDIPGEVLQPDSNLTWAMTPYGRLVLRGPTPKGLVEQDGIDGLLQPISATQATLKATTTSPFRSGDVGKRFLIRGSQSGNDGVYKVIDVPLWGAGSVVTLNGAFAAEPSGNLVYWELRTDSGNPTDPLIVSANAPSMLAELAKDFGIEVDTLESEARQRSWVKYINEWVDRKGLAKAYEILAAISGYIGNTFQLYNISFDVSLQLPPIDVFEITDIFGEDGVFSDASGSDVTLTAPSALLSGGFSVIHVGRYVRTQLAASGNNNQLFEIIGFLSTTSVRLRATGATPINPTSPDANNGTIRWALLRLYTSLPPLRPNFDDFDSDKMNALIPGFTVDQFCWQQPIVIGGGPISQDTLLKYKANAGLWTPSEVVTGQISGATGTVSNDDNTGLTGTLTLTTVTGHFLDGEQILGNLIGNALADGTQFRITVTAAPGNLNIVATAQQVDSSFVFVDGDIDVIEALGLWTLTDSLSRSAFIEAVPAAVPSTTLGTGNASNSYVGFDPAYTTPIRVSHVNPGPSNIATYVGVVFGATTDITVYLRTDGASLVLASAAEVAAAVDSDPIAAGLVVGSAYPGNGTATAVTSGFVTLSQNTVRRTFIGSSIPLALGSALLEYVCEPSLTCDFCGSYRVLLELELDTLLNEGDSAFERVFERTLERLKDVTPAHVELVPRIIQPITAILNLQATVEPVQILADLYAPVSLLYDETPVDAELNGTGDTIGGGAPNMTLTDSAALFTEALVGLHITITGATTPTNNGTFLVTGFTSYTTITYTNAAGVAEAFPGTWGVVMYETDSPLTATITTPP
jgi:hypothetical protein